MNTAVHNLYNGDTVYVEGYNDTFNVTMYENEFFSIRSVFIKIKIILENIKME